jgi:hypothetical protein
MRYLFVLHVHARNVDVFATRHKFLGILREVLQNDITILKVLHAHTKYYVWDFFCSSELGDHPCKCQAGHSYIRLMARDFHFLKTISSPVCLLKDT